MGGSDLKDSQFLKKSRADPPEFAEATVVILESMAQIFQVVDANADGRLDRGNHLHRLIHHH